MSRDISLSKECFQLEGHMPIERCLYKELEAGTCIAQLSVTSQSSQKLFH